VTTVTAATTRPAQTRLTRSSQATGERPDEWWFDRQLAHPDANA